VNVNSRSLKAIARENISAYNNEHTFNSLLVLQLFPLWIGLRVGSQKWHKFKGLVGSGNLDPRATLCCNHLTERSFLVLVQHTHSTKQEFVA